MHILFKCTFSWKVWEWNVFQQSLNMDNITNTKDGISKAKSLKDFPQVGLTKGPLFLWIAWGLLNARNKLIFENINIAEQEVLTTALIAARKWQQAHEKNGEKQPMVPRGSDHNTIEADCICCNTDASWKNQTDKAGLRWVFTDVNGRILEKGARTTSYIQSPLM